MIIKGNVSIGESSIVSLGNLKEVHGRFLSLRNCKNLTSLGNLEFVNGYLILSGCKNLKDLGKLRKWNNEYSIKLLGSGITKEYIEKHKSWLKYNCDWNN